MLSIRVPFPFIKWIIFVSLFISYIFFNLSTAEAASSSILEPRFISYIETGVGMPLVLIHAYPTDQRLWDIQRSELQKYFRVITLDVWGFGKTSATNGEAVTMTEYADEVKDILNQLHIQKAIIGGESMGGYIALAYLAKYPESVEGLILSDTQSIADDDATKAKREATAEDVLQNGTAQFIQDFMPKALSPNATDETKAFLQNILEAQPATAIASASRGMALREDTSALLAHTDLPILILTGDQDALISPLQSQNMHALAKNSRLVMISNAGHLSSLEQPTQWNQAVVQMFYKLSNHP